MADSITPEGPHHPRSRLSHAVTRVSLWETQSLQTLPKPLAVRRLSPSPLGVNPSVAKGPFASGSTPRPTSTAARGRSQNLLAFHLSLSPSPSGGPKSSPRRYPASPNSRAAFPTSTAASSPAGNSASATFSTAAFA